MQFPKLTPLQSRLVATIATSIILVILFFSLTGPSFAYAADLDSRIPADHNHPIILEFGQDIEGDEKKAASASKRQKPVQRGDILGRAPSGVQALSNNNPINMNIGIGQTQNWVFPKENIAGPPGVAGTGLPSDDPTDDELAQTRSELRKRQDAKKVYITLNTCMQPDARDSENAVEKEGGTPPQLQMWVSQSSLLTNPGPGTKDNPDQQNIDFTGGYAVFETETSDDIYLGISAPNTTSWTGIWNYEIAASIDAPFHSLDEDWANLSFVDGDSHAALLVTNDTTQMSSSSDTYKQWMAVTPPYGVFAHDQNDTMILGVQNSFCGLKNQAPIVASVDNATNQNVVRMVNRGFGGKPKEQFYITDLNASSAYYGVLTMEGNSTAAGSGVVGGGGRVWKAMSFITKAEDNCALVYNLTFCSDVAYAVPSNPQLFDPLTGVSALGALYDSNAATLYQNFNYSLQQVPCKTNSVQQYSLVRNCDDCARAYKSWLCAVTIPRCEDFGSTKPFLMPRNTAADFTNGSSIADLNLYNPDNVTIWTSRVASNSSRNPIIDTDVRPGPYKEVLPCVDLCHDLMQSCPASLGFSCPLEGRGLDVSYGKRSPGLGEITCSYLGADYYRSGAAKVKVGIIGAGVLRVVFGILIVLFLS